jgi:glycosyltransferase AglD
MRPTGNRSPGPSDASDVRLSLVVPFFDEEAILQESLSEIGTYLAQWSCGAELILADDGSRDRSGSIAREFARRSPVRCHVVSQESNTGKGGILHKGISMATGALIAYIDADLEIALTSLSVALDILEQRPEVDICIGSKRLLPDGRRRPRHRQLGTFFYNTLVRGMVHSRITDHQCGMKVFRRAVAQSLLSRICAVGWAWDTEFLLRAQLQGYGIVEVPVVLEARRRSRIPFWKVAGQLTTQLMAFRSQGLVLPRNRMDDGSAAK